METGSDDESVCTVFFLTFMSTGWGTVRMKGETLKVNQRQLLILQCLSRRVGTRDIQRQIREATNVEVPLRTLQRDLNELKEIFPIENDGENPQGWWMDSDKAPLQPRMQASKALVFLMAEEHLKPLLPAIVFDELRPWFEHARQQVRHEHKPWFHKVRVVPANQPLIPPEIKGEALAQVQEALLLNRQVNVVYISRSKQTTQTLCLHPLSLVQRGPVLYLIARKEGAEDVRTYAMHRMLSAEIDARGAQRTEDFDLDAYLEHGGMGFGNGQLVRLQALFSEAAAEHLYESRLSLDQQLEKQPDGRIKVTATVADTQQLQWWLRAMQAERLTTPIANDEKLQERQGV